MIDLKLLREVALFERDYAQKHLAYAIDRLQTLLDDAKRGNTSTLVMNASNPLSEIAAHAAKLDLAHTILGAMEEE